ncbi:MAG: hypothetical protein WAO61_07615 [Solirubrobacterales bacterium]
MRSFIKTNVRNSGLVLVVAFALLSVAGGTAVAGKLITGKSVKNSSLTGADVRNSSLTGADVKNNTVGPSDLNAAAKAALQGPTGATGATGSHGPMATSSSTLSDSVGSTVFEEIGGGSVDITAPEGATQLLVTFNAECAVVDPAAYRSQYVRILLDGAVVGNQSTFCSNTIDYAQVRYGNPSLQRAIAVTPGPHTVSVQHSVSNNTATGYLDDKTLSVITG